MTLVHALSLKLGLPALVGKNDIVVLQGMYRGFASYQLKDAETKTRIEIRSHGSYEQNWSWREIEGWTEEALRFGFQEDYPK